MDFRKMTLNEKLKVLKTVREDRDKRNMLWEEIMEKHDISLSRAKQLYNEGLRTYWRQDNQLWNLLVKHCGNMKSDIPTRIWTGLMRANIKTIQSLKHTDEIYLLRIRGVGTKYRGIILDMKKEVISDGYNTSK